MRPAVWVLVLALAACGDAKKPEPPAPPVSNPRALIGTMPPPATAPSAAGLAWTAPAAWKEGKPSSGARLAQWDVATDAQGDPVQCIIWGGSGGTDQDVVTNWVAQLGPSAKDGARVDRRDAGVLKVTRLAAKGAYTDTMRPGDPKPIPDASLLAAIVEGPAGKIHVKLVGPAALVDAAAPQFDEFLASMRVK